MLKDTLDRLMGLMAGGQFEPQARLAMALFRERTGASFEDDPSHEGRIALFTEWFILDYPKISGGLSPLDLFAAGAPGEEALAIVGALRKNVHDVFLVKWAAKGQIKLLAVYMDKSFIVDGEEKAGSFRKGDIFEARVISLDGKWRLLNGFLSHPSRAGKFIRGEMARIRGVNGAGLGAFIARLATMSLMSERSRNIDVDEIYKNEAA
jgi:hypothetical protein